MLMLLLLLQLVPLLLSLPLQLLLNLPSLLILWRRYCILPYRQTRRCRSRNGMAGDSRSSPRSIRGSSRTLISLYVLLLLLLMAKALLLKLLLLLLL